MFKDMMKDQHNSFRLGISSGFSREEMVQITIEQSKAPCFKVMMGATQPTQNAGWGTYLILHRMISAFILEHG
jgi:hypothetical protein